MRFPGQMAVAAVALSMMGGIAAKADTILHYQFAPGSYYDFNGGDSDSVTGSFSYDVDTQAVTDVNYTRGSDHFTTGSTYFGDPTQVLFGTFATSDYDVYQLQNSLALGGTDTITGGTHPAILIDAGGALVAGVPEPASWALMLLGVGAVGGVARRRRFAPVATA